MLRAPSDNPAALSAIARRDVLAAATMQREAWPEVILELVRLLRTCEDVAEQAYGERIAVRTATRDPKSSP